MREPSVKLAQAITESGMSLSQLEAATGVHTGTISRVATMQRKPSVDLAARLAEGLGLRLELVDLDNLKPCGHVIGYPSKAFDDTEVTCRDCGKRYRWVPVEVEG